MLEDHALVPAGEYIVPLIDIPHEAGVYYCDLCGKDGGILELKLNEAGNQFLCLKCRTGWTLDLVV